MAIAVHAVLQAGGTGRRLAPLTDLAPKAMIPVGGVPMAERLLRQFAAAGLRSVTVVTGWLGDQLRAHIERLDGLPEDLDIEFLPESRPMGNIGALAHFATREVPVLMAFADLVTDMDFAKLIDMHISSGADVTLASHHEPYRLQFGELSTEGLEVLGYVEKPRKTYLICSGVAVFAPAALDLIGSEPTGISELVLRCLAANLRVRHWPHGAFWRDVNSAEALAEVNDMLCVSTASPKLVLNGSLPPKREP